jgi:hypothetical protein
LGCQLSLLRRYVVTSESLGAYSLERSPPPPRPPLDNDANNRRGFKHPFHSNSGWWWWLCWWWWLTHSSPPHYSSQPPNSSPLSALLAHSFCGFAFNQYLYVSSSLSLPPPCTDGLAGCGLTLGHAPWASPFSASWTKCRPIYVCLCSGGRVYVSSVPRQIDR